MKDALRNMKLLLCLLCGGKYSQADVKAGKFFASTGICKACYLAGQAQPHAVWCFGKRDKVVKGKVAEHGYDPKAPECRSECPDRQVCRVFVKYLPIERSSTSGDKEG